jgi:hypothetical protein
VFWKAHVPIQRVQYTGDACGPYRDWHNEEHPLACSGTPDPARKVCFGTATTICEGLPDGSGNFLGGVVIDKRAEEVVLTSAMRAGWYRYVQEWHFLRDGTIEPRFRMMGSAHACTNFDHTHHVYWRLDFDLNGAPRDAVLEQFLALPQVLPVETARVKRRFVTWRIVDTATGFNYRLIPGPMDGVANAFSEADLWALQYHGGENGDEATAHDDNLDLYVNGEEIFKTDVVTWYAGHAFHPAGQGGCHVVGPTLGLLD